MNPDNSYTNMQRNTYNSEASKWTKENPDPVVGSFHQHNNWKDYENLFTRIENQAEKIGLDFACGPGRNIVKYKGRFKRLDGVDLSPINIENCRKYIAENGVEGANLYISDGVGIGKVPDNTYDFVMSTIALQHICVHEIRFNIFKGIYKALKDGGIFTAQMGYGYPSPSSVGYYENNYGATGTNRACDTRVEDPSQLKSDLEKIGFKDFNYIIGTTGPGDCHPNWIYFSAVK